MQNNSTLKFVSVFTLVLSAGNAFGANRFNFNRPNPSPFNQFASSTTRGLIVGGGTVAAGGFAADRLLTQHRDPLKAAAKEVAEHGAHVAVADARQQLNIARDIIVPTGCVLVGTMAANHAFNAINRDEREKAALFGGAAIASFGAAKSDTCVTM